MIENSFVEIESDGKRVTVNFFEDEKLQEGPAIFPARYASMGGICAYINTQFGTAKRLTATQAGTVQVFLGSPWPRGRAKIRWADAERI